MLCYVMLCYVMLCYVMYNHFHTSGTCQFVPQLKQHRCTDHTDRTLAQSIMFAITSAPMKFTDDQIYL